MTAGQGALARARDPGAGLPQIPARAGWDLLPDPTESDFSAWSASYIARSPQGARPPGASSPTLPTQTTPRGPER